MPDIAFREYLPYHKNVDEVPVSITDEDPVFTSLNILDVTDELPAGEYVLSISFEWSMSDTNDSALFRVLSPVTTGKIARYEPKDSNDSELRSVSFPFTWTGGAISFDFQASITAGAEPLSITYTSIELERKA